MIAETYWQLVTNIPHILSEITWDLILNGVEAVIVYGIWRGWLRDKIITDHDMKYHDGEHSS